MNLSRLLRIAVAIALTAYVLWKADPGRVIHVAAGADLWWVLGAMLLVLVDRALMAYRWMDLLCALSPGTRPPFGKVLTIFFTSTFVGTFLPSVGGDVYRAYSLARHDVHLAQSAASVLMDRVLGVLSIAIVGAAALLFVPDLRTDIAVSLLAAFGACAIVALVVFSDRAALGAERLTTLLPGARLGRIITVVMDSVRRYSRHHGELARVLVVSVVVQGIRVVQAWCLGRALGIELPLVLYFAYIPLVLLIMLLPITVNGMGTSQLAFERLFVPAGVSPPHAFALSVLFVALGIVGNLPGGLLYATASTTSARQSSAS